MNAYAFKEKAELATLGLRKDFKRMATEAKTTALDTFHTRTVFQKSATREERHCFLSLALPHSVWTANSVCGKPGWLEHKPRDHGFDPSVSLRGFAPTQAGATTLQLHSTDHKGMPPPDGRGAQSLASGSNSIQHRNYLVPTMYWTMH